MKRLFTYPCFDKFDKAWHCVFIGKSNNQLVLDSEEIQGIKWIDTIKLKSDIIENSSIYTPPFIEGMKKFFLEYSDEIKIG